MTSSSETRMQIGEGRVGMTHGTAVHSSGGGYSGGGGSSNSSSSSSRTSVDNVQNRSLCRVGMAHGTAVHSSSSGGGLSFSSFLGRVGLQETSGSFATNTGSSSSRGVTGNKCYVDNPYNRRLGRVGQPLRTCITSRKRTTVFDVGASKAQRRYVDNPYNRRLKRVGQPLGSCIISHKRKTVFDVGASVSKAPRRYVENPYNRKLGRVGLIVGTAICPSFSKGSSNNSSVHWKNPSRSFLREPANSDQCVTSGIDVDLVFRPLQRLDPEDNDLGLSFDSNGMDIHAFHQNSSSPSDQISESEHQENSNEIEIGQVFERTTPPSDQISEPEVEAIGLESSDEEGEVDVEVDVSGGIGGGGENSQEQEIDLDRKPEPIITYSYLKYEDEADETVDYVELVQQFQYEYILS